MQKSVRLGARNNILKVPPPPAVQNFLSHISDPKFGFKFVFGVYIKARILKNIRCREEIFVVKFTSTVGF